MAPNPKVTTASRRKQPFTRFGAWLDDHGLALANLIVNPIGYAGVSVLFELDVTWRFGNSKDTGLALFFLMMFFGIIISILTFRRDKSMSKMDESIANLSAKVQKYENQIDDLNAQQSNMLTVILANIFLKLEWTANERISVYGHINEKFVILGRYSSHPDFMAFRRKEFNKNDGFLHTAWISQHGTQSIDDLPDPSNAWDYHQAVNSRGAIEMDVLNGIRMKCRNYFLKTLSRGMGKPPIAIFVFESLTPGTIDEDRAGELVHNDRDLLVAIIENLHNQLSGGQYAKKLGF